MQVENIGGKRYDFVVVDDFSRLTWVNLLEKNQTPLMCLKICAHNCKEKKIVPL